MTGGASVSASKWHSSSALVLAIVILCLVLAPASKPAASQGNAPVKFKNVQVLKDLPADQLIAGMQFISASLGVECEFCHVRDAFEKDDKPSKKTARQMIEMTLAINTQNFRGDRAVTCNTCHRGSTRPVGIPMLDSRAPYVSEAKPINEPTVQTASDLPSADDVLKKYMQALGGQVAIEAVISRVETGTVRFSSGPAFPVEILSKSPFKQTMIVHLPAGDSVTTFDGDSGWSSAPGGPIRDLHQADLEGARLDADLQFTSHLKSSFQEFKVLRSERFADHDAVLLFAMNPTGPPLELYFDRDTGLLLRQTRFSDSPLGLNPTTIDYDDYKTFNGVQVPMHVTITRPNRTLDIHFDHVEQNTPVDDAKFNHQ